jgi:hypothetical protein
VKNSSASHHARKDGDMEFSYRISEEEYLRVFRPKLKMQGLIVMILFWVIFAAILMLVITAIQHFAQEAQIAQLQAVHRVWSRYNFSELFLDIGFLLLMVGLWVSHSVVIPKFRRFGYRKDPAMQGEFTVNLKPDLITIQNSVGTFYRSGWNVFFGWHETRGMIVLMSSLATPISVLISMAGLTNTQQDELRGILTAALPKK